MTTPIDMVGRIYGKLTVLSLCAKRRKGIRMWNCKCSCGTLKVVSGIDMRQCKIKSCGCYNLEKSRNQIKDICGHVFNRLTVIKYIRVDKKHNSLWCCKCICGNEIIARFTELKSGHTKSCGCFMRDTSRIRIKESICNGKVGVSNSEILFLNAIEEQYKIKFIRQYYLDGRFFDAKYNNFLFEIDAPFWHSTDKQKKNDRLKNKIAKRHNYKLIRIILVNRYAISKTLIKHKHFFNKVFNNVKKK